MQAATVFLIAALGVMGLGGCQSETPPAINAAEARAPADAPGPQTPAREGFRREARILANLALAHEYATFRERWGAMAAAAAAAGIGLEPQDADGRAYQELRGVKAFMDLWVEADARAEQTLNREFLGICEDAKGLIEAGARKILALLGPRGPDARGIDGPP